MSVDTLLIVVGAALLVLGLVSTLARRVWLSVPLLALASGVLLGPEVTGVVSPSALGDEHAVLEELARITLAVSLVATGLQFTRGDLRDTWRRGSVLLTAVMVAMWLSTSAGAFLLLDLELWTALLLGAVLTPTDPVVAASIVTGRLAEANLPRRLRRTLQLEAGANDGLAVVFVLVPLLVLELPDDDAATIATDVVRQIALAIGCGAALGWAAARAVRAAEDHEAMTQDLFLLSALALALLTLGATHALGGTGVLASFVGGVVFALQVGEHHRERLEAVQDPLHQLLVVPFFLLLGAVLPWDAWTALGLPGLAFAAWVLVLRRPPAAFAALRTTHTPRRQAAYLSFYGPVGVAAVYYGLLTERAGTAVFEAVFPPAALAVAVSVACFAVTATPGVRAYAGRRVLTTVRHPLGRGRARLAARPRRA